MIANPEVRFDREFNGSARKLLTQLLNSYYTRKSCETAVEFAT